MKLSVNSLKSCIVPSVDSKTYWTRGSAHTGIIYEDAVARAVTDFISGTLAKGGPH
jgi:hypothetical protein